MAAATIQYIFQYGEDVKVLRKTRGTITADDGSMLTVRPVLGKMDILIPRTNLVAVTDVTV